MDDVITDFPPPSRFFEDDLNNFAPPLPPKPSPSLVFSNPKTHETLRPALLIIAVSGTSQYVFHHVSSKSLIGSVILPEVTVVSGNLTEPSLGDKACNIYTLDDATEPTILISVQCSVPAERSHAVAKLLIGENIIPERVLIIDSVQGRNFRGKLSPDETFAYKLETSSERKCSKDLSLLKGVDYYPSGSVVDGLAAALLSRCEMKNIKGTLCLSWPEYGASAVPLVRSLILQDVLPDLVFSAKGNLEDEKRKFPLIKRPPYDSDMYT